MNPFSDMSGGRCHGHDQSAPQLHGLRFSALSPPRWAEISRSQYAFFRRKLEQWREGLSVESVLVADRVTTASTPVFFYYYLELDTVDDDFETRKSSNRSLEPATKIARFA